MTANLIQIKSFLGKFYSELAYSAIQDKYVKTGLDTFFDQRFLIQGNKTQMIVDQSLQGMIMIVSGNEVHVSKTMHDHPSIKIMNSMENPAGMQNNPRSLYEPGTFSTSAYLVCQNHTMINIDGEVDEPIYIRYESDYETFYNSVIIFNIASGIDVEIIEEYHSKSALNTVTNYILHPTSKLNLSTFYQNHLAGISFCYRNVLIQENAKYNHLLFGKGSSNVIDENKLHMSSGASAELLNCIHSMQHKFHSILQIQAAALDYSLLSDQRHIISGKGAVTFTPVVNGHLPVDASVNVSSLILDLVPESARKDKVNDFLSNIIERATLERINGSERFYNNKSSFLQV